MVEMLLKAGAGSEDPDGNGTTPLMLAASAGYADTVKVSSTGAPIRRQGNRARRNGADVRGQLQRVEPCARFAKAADYKATTKVVDLRG